MVELKWLVKFSQGQNDRENLNLNPDLNNHWQDFTYLLTELRITKPPLPWEPEGEDKKNVKRIPCTIWIPKTKECLQRVRIV